jgi:hypothetical protein
MTGTRGYKRVDRTGAGALLLAAGLHGFPDLLTTRRWFHFLDAQSE